MATIILDTDTVEEMAAKIFYEFEVLQSCTIKGFVDVGDRMLAVKGDLVVDHLKRLDRIENTHGGARRKQRRPKDSIGGYEAEKIWQWKKILRHDEFFVSIWRSQ